MPPRPRQQSKNASGTSGASAAEASGPPQASSEQKYVCHVCNQSVRKHQALEADKVIALVAAVEKVLVPAWSADSQLRAIYEAEDMPHGTGHVVYGTSKSSQISGRNISVVQVDETPQALST